MILITVLVILIQIISLYIFRPLTKLLNYLFEGNFLSLILLIGFAFLISINSKNHE